MTTTRPRSDLTVATDHPAKWSAPVLDAITEVIQYEHDIHGSPDRGLRVLDPFAGIGRQRLADALGWHARLVTGVELQPEWGDEHTMEGDATDLPAEWSGAFDAVVTSPCYGNRMADDFQATDTCKRCHGSKHVRYSECDHSSGCAVMHAGPCTACKGTGQSWRNTYAHALRRQGADLVPGSAAAMQWGLAYRDFHKLAISEMLRVTVPGGLLVVNMSNHIRKGEEQHVVEWWVNELLHRGCGLVEVRRVRTRRQGYGENRDLRVDGEVLIVMRTPIEPRLL